MLRLKNAKINKKGLNQFLKKRYTGRLMQKIACIFDWSKGFLDYNDFYTRLSDVLLHPKEPSDAESHKKILKKFAFQMFDMNCDHQICETDIFTFLELHNKDDDLFKQVLIYDIQDILVALRRENDTLASSDKVYDQT